MPLIDAVTMPRPGPPSAAAAPVSDQPAALPPVLFRDNALSRSANALHLVVLVSCLRVQFPKLVADPVAGLAETLVILVSIQAAWVLICCPPAGSRAGKVPAHPLVPVLLSLALTAFSVPVIHVVFVLFGAPFLTHVPHTLLCSATLAVLAVFPAVYAHGVDAAAWRALGSASAPWDEVFCGLWGAAVGAWLGAVPIPLDWDREWQKWPVTVVCGVFAGYVVGRVVGNVALHNMGYLEGGRAKEGKGVAEGGGREQTRTVAAAQATTPGRSEGKKGGRKRAKKD